MTVIRRYIDATRPSNTFSNYTVAVAVAIALTRVESDASSV